MAFVELVAFLAVLYSQLTTGQSINVTIEVDTSKPIAVVDELFVGVTIDAANMPVATHFNGFNFSSEKIRLLASALAPGYLRIGGTAGDSLTFNPTGENITDGNHTFTGPEWDTINTFAHDVDWRLIFGLNLLNRRDGAWDPSSVIQLFKYTVEKQYQMAGFELGNEPTNFPDKYKTSITGKELGRDFLTLKSLLAKYPEFDSTMILGPDINKLSGQTGSFFTDFLNAGGKSAVDRITLHHYYENGLKAKLEDFTNPEVMDSLKTAIELGQNLSRPTNPTTPIWLGETSACFKGGAPGMSDRYVAGFLWLDKLGLAAKMGIKGVMRQSFFGGNHSLIGPTTFDPMPDYWLTYLYKKLSGSENTTILNANASNPGVRVYAHCVTMVNIFGYRRGSVVLSVLVTGDEEVKLSVPQFKGQRVEMFWLQPVGNLTSQKVTLNGIPMELNGLRFPQISPLVLTEDLLTVPGKTFGFLAFPLAGVKVCEKLPSSSQV